MRRVRTERGLSLIDVVVGMALMVLVFLGIFGVIRLAIELIGVNKAAASAVALANEQVEFLRNLSYDEVAVIGGIPAGDVPAEEEITINNTLYTRTTDVRYVDASQDGTGAGDTNGVITDYKSIKVEVSWFLKDRERSVFLVTSIVPKGIENAIPGSGILTINVRDALGTVLEDADVTITNTSVTPAINLVVSTNASGTVSFVGAPTSTAAYEIMVTRDGYSTAQTYSVSAENPNPNPGHLTVIEDTVTTATFIIDLLSMLDVYTYTATGTDSFDETFVDTTLLDTLSNTEVFNGALQLQGSGGVYPGSGSARSEFIAPENLISWDTLTWSSATIPPFTSAAVSLYYDNGGTPTLIPDAVLPGNSSGFGEGTINIEDINPTTYPEIAIGATLQTSDPNFTPRIDEWLVAFVEGPVPLPDIGFTMQGTKTIGTDGSGTPIHKYDDAHTTGSTGTVRLYELEWDAYDIVIDPIHDVDVYRFCPKDPVSLEPGDAITADIVTITDTPHTLRVIVEDALGVPINGGTVEVTRGALLHTNDTSECGQVFFGSMDEGTLSGGDQYELSVTASGYVVHTEDIDVTGDTVMTIVLVAN